MKSATNCTSASRIQAAIELNYEFMWRSIVQCVGLMTKGATYYFTIIVVIAGVLLSLDTSERCKHIFAVVLLVVSPTFAVIRISVAFGVYKGMTQLENSLKAYNHAVFHKLNMNCYLRRGKTVGLIVTVCCLIILVAITCGIALILSAQPPPTSPSGHLPPPQFWARVL